MKEYWKLILERFLKLFSVKSIVTITFTIVFAVLSLRGVISAVQFMAVFTTIIGFYFGTQKAKENTDNKGA